MSALIDREMHSKKQKSCDHQTAEKCTVEQPMANTSSHARSPSLSPITYLCTQKDGYVQREGHAHADMHTLWYTNKTTNHTKHQNRWYNRFLSPRACSLPPSLSRLQSHILMHGESGMQMEKGTPKHTCACTKVAKTTTIKQKKANKT